MAGEEAGVLDASISRGLREFKRFVVDVAAVTRVDSTGIGLLVRFLSHTRNRAGDLRLSSAPPFLNDLLKATRLNTIFRLYDSEEQAILSFLKEPVVSRREASAAGPSVLFVDRSVDLCAFVRALLTGHGYETVTTCVTYDAKLLLTAARFDYLVLGPDTAQSSSEKALEALKAAAQGSAILQLQSDFKYDDPERAGAELLRKMQTASTAGSA